VQELPKPKFGKRTYQRLAGAWSDMRQPTQLRQNMWVAVESLCGLPCCFGVTIRDLQALAMELAWDYPRGIAAIHLDRCKTLVFSPDDGPSVARVESALRGYASSKVAASDWRCGKTETSLNPASLMCFSCRGKAHRGLGVAVCSLQLLQT